MLGMRCRDEASTDARVRLLPSPPSLAFFLSFLLSPMRPTREGWSCTAPPLEMQTRRTCLCVREGVAGGGLLMRADPSDEEREGEKDGGGRERESE